METNNVPDNRIILSKEDVKTSLDKVSQYRSIIPAAFALAFILFFFSFSNFKCNGAKVASLKGISLVTGTHLKLHGADLFNGDLPGNPATSKQAQKIPANFWAILAFLSSVTGAILFYKKRKKESLFGALLGAAGFISLLVLQIIIKDKAEEYTNEMVKISAGFSFGYWLCLISFFVAGGISFLRLKKENEKPSGNYGNFSPEKKVVPIQVNIITQQNDDTENNNL